MADANSVLVVTIVVMSAGSALYTLRTYMEPHMKVAINLAEANVKQVHPNGTLLEHSREILPPQNPNEAREVNRNLISEVDFVTEGPDYGPSTGGPGRGRRDDPGAGISGGHHNMDLARLPPQPSLDLGDAVGLDGLERENEALISTARPPYMTQGLRSGTKSKTHRRVLLEAPTTVKLNATLTSRSQMVDEDATLVDRDGLERPGLTHAAVERGVRPLSRVEYEDRPSGSEYEYIELPMGRIQDQPPSSISGSSSTSSGINPGTGTTPAGTIMSSRDYTEPNLLDGPMGTTIFAANGNVRVGSGNSGTGVTLTPTTLSHNNLHNTSPMPTTTQNAQPNPPTTAAPITTMFDRRTTVEEFTRGSSSPTTPPPDLDMTHEKLFHEVDLVKIDRSASSKAKRTVVQVRQGLLEGVEVDGLGRRVVAFLGVPYAHPPIGEYRFRRPRPLAAWKGIRKVKSYGPPCLQYFPNNTDLPMNMLRKDISEDCLHLNVWTMLDQDANQVGPGPSDQDTSSNAQNLQPVMLFLHGGAFTYGSNAVDEQDGRILAAYSGLVVVTINYRLGPLGFADGRSEEAPGNMGLHDMLMALKWIKQNIASFGGDPEQVTLVGHQSGAMAASMFLLSPMARTLFKRAILQSGAATVFNVYYERSFAAFDALSSLAACKGSGMTDDFNGSLSNAADLRRITGAGLERPAPGPAVTPEVMQCMRALSIERLKRAADDQLSDMLYSYAPKVGDEINPLPFQKALDGSALLSHTGTSTSESDSATHGIPHLGPQKEILIGSNADEGSLFLHLGSPDLFPRDRSPLTSLRNLDDAKQVLGESLKDWGFTNATMHLLARFFLDKVRTADPRALLRATYHAFGDLAFTCPTVYFAERFSASSPALTAGGGLDLSNQRNAYYYYFTHKSDAVRRSGGGDWLGSAHGDEIQYIFGVPLRYPYRYTGTDIDFSKSLMRIWSTFARTGKPPRVNGREWPRYTAERPIYVELNGRIMKEGKQRTGSGPHRDNCDTWKYAYKLFND